MATQYAINGYVIPGKTQTSGMWLLKDTEYAPALSPRRAVVEIPGVHYAIPQWLDPMSQITVGMKVRIQGEDADDLREQWNILTGLLGMGYNRPITLTRYRGEHTETAEAQLLSTTSPDFFCNTNRADVQIVFNIPGGAWRGEEITQTFNETPTPSTASLASSMPITDALIRLPGPVGFIEVTDAISGTGVTWSKGSLTVASDEYLLIDPSLMVAKIVDFDTWDITEGVDVSGRLVYMGLGPFTMVSLRSGPTAAQESGVGFFSTESPGPRLIRARPAVV